MSSQPWSSSRIGGTTVSDGWPRTLTGCSPTPTDWALLFCLAMLPGTLGHFLTNWAHPHTSAFVVSIMFLAVPVIACAGAALILGETLNATQVVGAVIVLVAVGAVVATAQPAAGEELAESAAETDAP